jgi:hypothetical protein
MTARSAQAQERFQLRSDRDGNPFVIVAVC